MKIYKKCPCCGKTMFLMMGSDFGNEVELGSAFGSKDNIPHTDTNHEHNPWDFFNKDHEEDWECLTRFINCLKGSHGEVFISLKERDKSKIPESYKETILNFTEGGFKPEEKSKTEEPRRERARTEEPQNKTIKDWYETKRITYQDYKLLTTPWTESREGDLFIHEVVLDTETPFSWTEIQDYLRRAKQAQRKEQEKKRQEEEIKRKMNDGKDWSKISLDFRQAGEWVYKKQWIQAGFTYESCKEWIDIGMKADNEDFMFCAWLRDEKKMTPQQVLNSGRVEKLREEWERTTTHFG